MEKRLKISLFVSLILILLSGSVKGNCRYRNNGNFSEETFSVFADFGCYKYTQKKFFIDGGLFRNISTCLFGAYKLPGIILDDKCEVFHHNNSRIQHLVRESFVNEVYFERWIDCCEDALQCCQKMQQSEQEDGSDLCPALWDGWTCFSSALAGTTVEYPCPIYAYSGQGPKCTHFSQKQCYNNGTWSVQTNYATCAINQRLISRTTWHIIMLGLSVAFCLPALVIFFVYKSLNKFVLIRNLILAIVIRSILVIMSKKLIILDELVQEEDTVISKNGVPCRILSFFEKLTANAVFTCMLLEAIHLHRLLTNIFGCRKGPSGLNMMYYYVGGALVSILTAISWAIAMALANDQYCWVVTDGTDFQWINDTPRLLMLAINFILLLHIVLCLRKTFKYNPNERHKYIRRTAEVSLICLPLFGVPFLFVAVRPETKSCPWEQFYYFVAYALEGLQGIFVAILHCYINCEVRRTLRDSWCKLSEYLPDTFKMRPQSTEITWDSGYEHCSRSTSCAGDYSSRKSSFALSRSNSKCPTVPEEERELSTCSPNMTISVDKVNTWTYRDDGFEAFDVSLQKEQPPDSHMCSPLEISKGNGRVDSQV